ncbi:hypothetical protein Mlute_00023 [Meiothermus luteus]|jgi:hypothetical protein|uniref:Uncharacterized protein n=1 Tax=Meiothermus luteus TaxID=2026184 RepID=A0A399F662_9DEIN|nr:MULTISPECIES: hypothetical protein [Meiothermus]MCL6531587.1 hypothetical protein [Meiothermus ruber]RIH90101.1 hypothetical protein Mlute_00023 [Meiothermus luteus]
MKEIVLLLLTRKGLARCKVVLAEGKTIILSTPAGRVGFPRWALIPEGAHYRVSCRYEIDPQQESRLESALGL